MWAKGVGDDKSTAERLAARLGALEKKLASEANTGHGLGGGRGCYGGFGSVLGGTGDAGGLASAAVDDIQVTLGGEKTPHREMSDVFVFQRHAAIGVHLFLPSEALHFKSSIHNPRTC